MLARSARLGLELLTDRNAPSSIAGNDVASADWLPDLSASWMPAYVGQVDSFLTSDQKSNQPPNTAPVIKNFIVTVGAGWIGTFSGQVEDENPAGLTVTLTGVQLCLGTGQSVTTDENGNFSFQGFLRRTLDTGSAFADTTDAQGLAAETENYFVIVE